MDKAIRQGKYTILTIIGVVLLADIISIIALYFIQANSGGLEEARYELLKGSFRVLLTAILMFCLYQGQQWAKGITVALFLISGFMSLLSLVNGFHFFTILLGLVYTFFGMLILKNKNIQSFLESQMVNASKRV